MPRYQVKDEECIFSRAGYQGVYVLRCDIGRCKKKLGREGPTIFTSHPFKDRLALDHFEGEVHQINYESDIFRRFAIRGMPLPHLLIDVINLAPSLTAKQSWTQLLNVSSRLASIGYSPNTPLSKCRMTESSTDFSALGNLEKKDADDSGVGNRNGDDETLRPTNTQQSSDKGKKPERPYNLYVPSRASAEPSTSASAAHANETFEASFYRAGPNMWDDDGGSPVLGHGHQGDAE